MLDTNIYRSEAENQWCPGCSNFAVLMAIKKALASLDKYPHQVCLVSGIGQAAKLPHYIKANFFNGLHGRAIPAATGIALANPGLTTIVTTGDGDCYGEGGNHFIHALRRNPDITVIIHDNRIYALTKGQASPTTPIGTRTRLQFSGVEAQPIQGLATAITHRAPFVARGYAGDTETLVDLIVQAIRTPGFSLVETLQPCITWGEHGSKWKDWWEGRVVELPSEYDPHNQSDALEKALLPDYPLPIGVIYRGPRREVFGSSYHKEVDKRPLAEIPWLEQQEFKKRLAQMRWGKKGA
jgi:2-oxoglutarate/2-oxoacid ferredoxin oxidoreductase subunit beta